jgi:hypothetical protein
MTTEIVIGRALFGILQRFVGLGHFLEFLLGARFLRHVGMIFARELAVRLLDLIGAGRAGHAERGVVILVFHAIAA